MSAARSLIAALAIACLALPAAAQAAPPPPIDLSVVGGDGWRSDDNFELRWRNPGPSGEPLAAVDYQLRDESGAVLLGPQRIEQPVERLDVAVPRRAGAYRIEVWLEDRAGAAGPAASTHLLFDDTRPADVSPLPIPGWVGRAEMPFHARVAPPEYAPPSGIRGYAISVDRNPNGQPCAGAERCSEDETDLRGGAGDDVLDVGELPEGLSYVHAVAVSGSGMRSAKVGTVPVRVDTSDPAMSLAGAPESWVDHPVVVRATASDAASGMRSDGPDGPFTAIAVDGGPPSVSPGASAGATVIPDGVHTISYYARYAAGNVADGAIANGRVSPQPAVAVVRIDREPPTVAFLPSTHPDDPELIEARVSDPLSGPDPVRGWIGVRAAGSGEPFEPLPTAAEGGLLRARWRSDEYPRGEYQFQAVGRDRAGNAAIGTRRAGGSPMVLPSPLKTTTVLGAWLGAAGESSRTVPYGTRAAYRGRIALPSGHPLAGMPVRVVERFAPGSGLAPRETVLESGAEGRFALRLAPGPSREVRAFFAGTPARARAATPRESLAVRSGVSLSSSAPIATIGGRPVVFRGAVAGATARIAVQLQFRLPGRAWSQFRTVQTDRRGRFRYAYRFSDDDSRGVRFLFRAYVADQDEWPYEPGGSPPVAVRGR
jgi:hypothetical protein